MKPETSSTNIHVFRVNRTVQNKQSQTQSSNSATSSSSATLTVNSRTSLSAKTKRQICQDHLDNPRYTQEALAFKYGCKRTTVAKVSPSSVFFLIHLTYRLNMSCQDYKIKRAMAGYR